MDLKERGPRQRRSFDDNRAPRRSFDDGREPRRSFDDGRERTVRWPPACRPAPELQREMDAALAEQTPAARPSALESSGGSVAGLSRADIPTELTAARD